MATIIPAAILALINATIGVEGKPTNDPLDSGGVTVWGVTEFVARAYGYNGPMLAMPRDTAVTIYYQRYFVAVRFDAVYAIDPAIGTRLFDIGVNMGQPTGATYMQRALNVLNNGATDWPDITADGSVGNLTIAALNALIARRGNDGRRVLLNMIKSLHSVGYINIAEVKPTQERFEFGWQLQRALA